MRNSVRTVLLLCLMLLLVVSALFGCGGMPNKQVSTFDDLADDEVVIVGRIELKPPLQEGEQHLVTSLSSLTASGYRNMFFLFAGEKLENIKERKESVGPYDLTFMKGTQETYFQKDFYLKGNRQKSFYISGGFFYTTFSPTLHELMYLPGGFKVEMKPGDRAVYVGTIEYHRDELFRLSKLMVKSDYARALAEFKKKFGEKHKLQERLAVKLP